MIIIRAKINDKTKFLNLIRKKKRKKRRKNYINSFDS